MPIETKRSSRRDFLSRSLFWGAALGISGGRARAENPGKSAIAVATWDIGAAAVSVAARLLAERAAGLDAVERGVNQLELDPAVDSVGLGGMPNRDGVVELDAAILDGPSELMGSVAGLQDVAEAISVARKVGQSTAHITLCGQGAQQFALQNGFQRRELLTPESRSKWESWKKDPGAWKRRGHDTVSLIVRDKNGDLFAGCSSSGLSWKIPGRVGDAALIGSGIYLDNQVGAAVATGIGELCIRHSAAFATVEMIRQGLSPQQACEEAIRRIIAGKQEESRFWQVGMIALGRAGGYGAAAIQRGFQVASAEPGGDQSQLREAVAMRNKELSDQ